MLTKLTAENRYKQRLVKNKLVDAVRYTLNEKKYLYTFLEDDDVPIDNNRAENAIRPLTVGRKN